MIQYFTYFHLLTNILKKLKRNIVLCDAERLLLGGNCNCGVYNIRGYGVTCQLSVSFECTLFDKGEQYPHNNLFNFCHRETCVICTHQKLILWLWMLVLWNHLCKLFFQQDSYPLGRLPMRATILFLGASFLPKRFSILFHLLDFSTFFQILKSKFWFLITKLI